MEELISLLSETEEKLIKEIRGNNVKEAKELLKLWEHIIEVQTELTVV